MRKQLRRQVAIPVPATDVVSLHAAAIATKELVETLAGQRGSALDAAVTWADLLEAGLIKPEQVPTNVGS